MIQIRQLSFTYPNQARPALSDISLHVSPGEFVLLAGPSGSGKSTLLRCLNGLVPHFSGGTVAGSVRISGHDPIKEGPTVLSQTVGFVFQDPEAQAIMDVVEPEMAFGLENAGLSRIEIRSRIDEAFVLLGMEHLRRRRLSTLSAGEKQLVSIATVLVNNPRILALDEPTSQLDPRSAEEVLRAIDQLHEKLSMTVILAEHRLERIAQFANRLCYLRGGKVAIDEPIRQGLTRLRQGQRPPLTKLAMNMGWDSSPLSVEEGREFATDDHVNPVELDVSKATTTVDRTPLVNVTGLHYAYDSVPVLTGVDLSIDAGEAVVLGGRNGAGKSTLLKCIVGLLKAAKGSVKTAGKPTAGLSVAEVSRTIAYLPQNPDDLLFAETVEDELLATLQNHGLTISNASIKPRHLLDRRGLSAYTNSYPRDLSVGERQRVALGAIMITNPSVLLLDEPTRGLDFKTKRNLIALWKQIQLEGKSLLIVTHDVELAARVASLVLILDEGKIIANGPPQEILGKSSIFGTQISHIYPGTGWLTANDVIRDVKTAGDRQ